jgi:HCOMODA/2-hydroxy-3-carboxy-muconic semialdehyde decarboxylase
MLVEGFSPSRSSGIDGPPSLREAVFRAIYTKVNARLEDEPLRLGRGQVVFLNEEEASQATATNAGVLVRAWDLWKTRALAAAC